MPALKCVHIGAVPLPVEHPDSGRLWSHPGRWVLDLAKAQKAHTAVEPAIVINVPGSSCDYETVIEGIPCLFLRCQPRLRAATFFFAESGRMAAAARALHPDVVHAHGTEGAHLVAARRSDLPHVVTVQGLYSYLNPILQTPWYGRQSFIAWLENYTLRRTRFAIAKSGFVMDLLRQRFPHLQVFQIPNTFDPACLALPPVAKEPFSLVYVGTMNPWKGVHLLAQAVAQLARRFPQLSLRLIGGGREDTAYWRPQEEVLRRALGTRLQILDQLPRTQVLEHVARSAVLVAPSLWEMFGNQVIEALLLRTTCVVSSGTALAENIQRFGNGVIFRNGDAADLAARIEEVLQRPAGVEAEAAREKVSAYLQPARVALDTFQVYQQVLGIGGKA